jgi:hypothetical protein
MALAVYTIQLSQLSQKIITVEGDQELVGIQDSPLADGDHIWLSVEPSDVGANGIEISLSSAPHVTWYKEIKAFDGPGDTLGWIATQDAEHGPVSMKIADVTLITNLVFTKAKAFGIHTGMYQVTQGLLDHRGHKLDFNWASD